MNRNRQNYQCDVLLLNDGTDLPNAAIPAANVDQIHRVQDGNFSMNITREDVNQWGQQGRIGTVVVSSPEVTADFTYLMSNMKNEVALGFNLSDDFTESFTKNLLSADAGNPIAGAVKSGRNFYMLTCPEGNDANIGGFPVDAEVSAISISKAYLTDYSFEASVGSIPTTSFSIKASNQCSERLTVPTGQLLEVTAGFANEAGMSTELTTIDVSDSSPTLTPFTGVSATLPSALRPGDITLDLDEASVHTTLTDGINGTGAHIQSFSLNIPLSRTPLERLGNNFAFAEEVDFPIQVTVNVSAIVADLKDGCVYDQICSPLSKDLAVTFKAPCNGPAIAKYLIKGVELESESFSQSIGSNKTVDLTFTAQIGGPEDLSAGVFVSGQIA